MSTAVQEPKNNNPISIRLPRKTKNRLKLFIKNSDKSQSSFIAQAVENQLDLLDWQKKGVEKAIKELDEGKYVDGDIAMEWMMSLGTDHELPRPSSSQNK